jgi:hypothetical protein
MRPSPEYARTPPTTAHSEEPELHRRISAEFREMPGLTLTLPQAARLFSLDVERCERVLVFLVEGGVLTTNGRAFARAGAGRRCA